MPCAPSVDERMIGEDDDGAYFLMEGRDTDILRNSRLEHKEVSCVAGCDKRAEFNEHLQPGFWSRY